MRPTIYVSRMLAAPAMETLKEYFEVEVNPHDRIATSDEIISATKDKDALLCLLTDPIDATIMDACPQLKVISNHAVGYNNINVDDATARKIPVCFTPGVLTETSADLAFALLMAVSRRLVESDRVNRAGDWSGWGPLQFLGSDIYDKTLGVVGLGRIGEAVARRAKGFNMKLLYTDPNAQPDVANSLGAKAVELDELLQEADYVTLHVPLNAETTHLIGAPELTKMKSSAFLINTSRGPIIHEEALVEALRLGEIAGAGLDVYEKEPRMADGLKEFDNTVLLPHIASATIETRTKMAMLAAENAIRVIQGEEPHAIVNPEVLSEALKGVVN